MSIFETIYPGKICIGDTIGIAAPAGTFNMERFSSGIGIIKSMGFNTLVPDEVMQEDKWFAGNDETRADVLHSLFLNPDISAIICARGGYGSMRLLEKIDYDIVRNNPKIFAGFSDITALLLTFYQRTGLICYHAPVVTSLTDADGSTVNAFKTLLMGGNPFSMFANPGIEVCRGRTSGRLMGGNLATLNHLTGTGFMPDFDGAVLMLEDISEPPYKIDRMLTQMQFAGVFKGVKGIVLGQFNNCGGYEQIIDIFDDKFSNQGIPVVAGFSFGHTERNLPFPIGADVTLDSSTLSVVCSR